MGIGLGVFLLAVGAILSFAVRDAIAGVDLALVGYILMGAGVLALVLGLVQNAQRARPRHTEDLRVVDERPDHPRDSGPGGL